MNSITQLNYGFPNNYEVISTIRGWLCVYLHKIIAKIASSKCGTLLDELLFRICRKVIGDRVLFKIGDPKFVQQLNPQQVIKYGAIGYVIAAMLFIPSGICSQQYLPLRFDVPIIVSSILPDASAVETDAMESASPESEAEETDAQAIDEVQVEESEPDLPFQDHIMQAAQTYQVDAALIRAIIMAESSYNPKAVSHRGAQGLMQLMPTTARWLGVEDSFDPALNIDGGVRYFKRLLDRFDGNIQLALAAYNAGSRYVRKYGGVPPFRATRNYIKKVLNYHRLFQGQTAANEHSLTTS